MPCFVFQPDAGSYYTAWSSASSLVAKGLLIRKSHPPKYSACTMMPFSYTHILVIPCTNFTGFLWVTLEHHWPFGCCSRVRLMRGAHSQTHQCLLVTVLHLSSLHHHLLLARLLEERDTALVLLQGHIYLQPRSTAHRLASIEIFIHLLCNLLHTVLF